MSAPLVSRFEPAMTRPEPITTRMTRPPRGISPTDVWPLAVSGHLGDDPRLDWPGVAVYWLPPGRYNGFDYLVGRVYVMKTRVTTRAELLKKVDFITGMHRGTDPNWSRVVGRKRSAVCWDAAFVPLEAVLCTVLQPVTYPVDLFLLQDIANELAEDSDRAREL